MTYTVKDERETIVALFFCRENAERFVRQENNKARWPARYIVNKASARELEACRFAGLGFSDANV